MRSNGLLTYVVPDIAYHYNKLVTGGSIWPLDVLGADHHGYVPRLKAALQALGVDPARLQVVLMQMVRLIRDGEVVKASKRSGKAITLVTLLEEIPIDAARFYFNLREANSQLDFDLDLAVEQSASNPCTMSSTPTRAFAPFSGIWKGKGSVPVPARRTSWRRSRRRRNGSSSAFSPLFRRRSRRRPGSSILPGSPGMRSIWQACSTSFTTPAGSKGRPSRCFQARLALCRRSDCPRQCAASAEDRRPRNHVKPVLELQTDGFMAGPCVSSSVRMPALLPASRKGTPARPKRGKSTARALWRHERV